VKRESEEKGEIWVLETQTKGTGANMVPLSKVLRKPGTSDAVPGFVFRKPAPREPQPPVQAVPHRFKVTDVMTREPLADDVDARGAVEALRDVRSIVDVVVHVWEPDSKRWRLLTFGETKALWDYRDLRDGPLASAGGPSSRP
jgi:hypothetical protein